MYSIHAYGFCLSACLSLFISMIVSAQFIYFLVHTNLNFAINSTTLFSPELSAPLFYHLNIQIQHSQNNADVINIVLIFLDIKNNQHYS